MKRCFAIVFLSVFLITYLLPVATLVKADVVIGDNNQVVSNENAYILGRKIALMESIPDLLNSGVTELTIENVDDLDEYLEFFWGEIGDALDYVVSSEGMQELSNDIRNSYLINLNNYLSYIDNRAHIIGDFLGSPSTTLLKTYLVGNTLGKIEYVPNSVTLPLMQTLSQLNNGNNSPVPSPNINYLDYIDHINGNGFYFKNWPQRNAYNYYPLYNYSYYTPNTFDANTDVRNVQCDDIIDINIFHNNDVYYYNCIDNDTLYYLNSYGVDYAVGTVQDNQYIVPQTNSVGNSFQQYKQGTLEQVFIDISHHFKNVNIYVDGVLWAYVGNVVANPTMDIDGYLTIYGDDNPPRYDIKPDTTIDYDTLYTVIYNAIRDNLPISQGDITYYDSHDTIYSPTIINNYGSDPDGEDDWIESILDYAVVPEFRTSLLAPIETPLVNGLSVMVTLQDTIPEEILYVLGAVTVLLLFVCVINKMTK